MKATVEHRVFRTWEADVRANRVRAWMLLLGSLVNRYSRAWYVYMIMVLGIFGAMLGLFLSAQGSDFYAAGLQGIPVGPDPGIMQEGPIQFILLGMMLFTVIVAAPSIAEDVRFNAQLFYFSKPMRVSDYMLGKGLFNALGLAVVGIVPMAILSITVLGTGPGDAQGITDAMLLERASQEDIDSVLDRWRHEGVDSWSDAFYLALMPLAGIVSISVGLTGFTLALSSFTRRAWHAAVGVFLIIQGWSAVGAINASHIETSERLRYHPNGWSEAVLFLPNEQRFRYAHCVPESIHYRDPAERGYDPCLYENLRIEGADTTILVAHVALWLVGILSLIVAIARLKRLEGAA